MKDRLQLIVVGCIVSALAWTFWHVLGQDGFLVLSTIMLVLTTADNVRLRRQLRSNAATGRSDKAA